MRTVSLEAVLQSEIRVVEIRTRPLKRVVLEVDGQRVTLKEGDQAVSNVKGTFKNDRV